MECSSECVSTFLIITSLVSFYIYSGAPSSRFDIALEYDVNTEDDDDTENDSDATEKMTNKQADKNESD